MAKSLLEIINDSDLDISVSPDLTPEATVEQAHAIRKELADALLDADSNADLYSPAELDSIYHVAREITRHYPKNKITQNAQTSEEEFETPILREDKALSDLTATPSKDDEYVFCVASGYVYSKNEFMQSYKRIDDCLYDPQQNKISSYERKKLGLDFPLLNPSLNPRTNLRSVEVSRTYETDFFWGAISSIVSVACAEIVWMYFEGSNKEYDTVAVATAASCFALATISGVAVNRYKGLARSSQTDAEYASHFYNMHRAWLVFNTALCVPTIMSCYVLIFAEIASRFAEPPAGVSSGLIIACVLIAMVYNASLTLGRTTLDLTAQEQDDIEHTSTTVQACLGIPVATTLIGVMIGALVEGEFSKKAIEHGVGYGIVVCLALAAIYAGAKLMTPCLSNTISWMRGRTSQANGPNEEMRLLQHVAAPIN